MTDLEIKQYLTKNNWVVNPNKAIMDIFNTSPQIINKKYDSDNSLMTIYTPNHAFTFYWIIRKS